METLTSSKRTLQKDPQYFGVFANMARHNVYKILCEVADRAGLPQPATEESLIKAHVIRILNPAFTNDELQLKKLNRPDKCSRVIDLLNKHFKFLPVLNKSLDARNPDTEVYYIIISRFLNQLDTIRNQYTHAISTKTNFNEVLIKNLEMIFDDGLPEIKKRFLLEENEMNHLRRYKGFDKREKRPKRNSGFQYSFYENKTISEKGLAFFICLFLEPAYSALFLKKMQGFKAGSTKAYRATFELYILSSCKLPHNKLESTGDNKTALLLDMLNELQRCPKELYDTLSPENQKKFETVSADSLPDEDNDATEEGKSILLRKQNRFPYFSLRYIDHIEMFKKLRFHVDLGNYHYHSYDKEMDNQSIIRRWEKKLLSFGRLNEISEKAKSKWGDLLKDPSKINDSTPAPFIVQTQAHYHFIGNNIGLKDSSRNYAELPELKAGKEIRTKTQEADYYIATDELTGLLLYNYFVEKYKGPSAEDLIIKFKENVFDFLNAIISGKIKPIEKDKITNQHSASVIARSLSEGAFKKEFNERKDWLANLLKNYKLEPHQIPETLSKYLMGLEPVNLNERAAQIAKFHIEETNTLLKRAGGPGSRENQKSKKQLRKQQRNLHLSAGDSGSFLAKDMLYLQPPEKDANGKALPKGKANPDEFQLLQARLAYFGAEKNNLERTFKLCKLNDSNNPHPFLNRINWMQYKDSLSFYIAYLNERKLFFKQLSEQKNFADYYFLTGNAKTHDREYFINLAKVINTKPVNLPRGLFKDGLVNLLQQKADGAMKSLVQGENIRHNVVYLINEWYKLQNDSYQPFYDFGRNYRTVDEWFDNRSKGSLKTIDKLYKTTAELTHLAAEIKKSDRLRNKKEKKDADVFFYEVYKKKVIENEKLIRHFRATDQMLFLMCKEMLSKEDEKIREAFKESFNLKDISPDNPKSILETRLTFALPVQTDSKGIKHIEEKFKVKDYGKMRKYLKDKRLGSLLEFFEDNKIKLSVLKDQLKDYEKYRLKLFDNVYYFEKACEASPDFKAMIDSELAKISEDGVLQSYVRHSEIIKRYADLFKLQKDEVDVLNTIRNAFSHNQFPVKNKVLNLLNPQKSILDGIMDFVLPLYTNNIEKIKASKNVGELSS